MPCAQEENISTHTIKPSSYCDPAFPCLTRKTKTQSGLPVIYGELGLGFQRPRSNLGRGWRLPSVAHQNQRSSPSPACSSLGCFPRTLRSVLSKGVMGFHLNLKTCNDCDLSSEMCSRYVLISLWNIIRKIIFTVLLAALSFKCNVSLFHLYY